MMPESGEFVVQFDDRVCRKHRFKSLRLHGCGLVAASMVELSSHLGPTEEARMTEDVHRFLCISSYEKGQDFMRQCAEMGVKPTLLTVDKLRDAPWPRDVLE